MRFPACLQRFPPSGRSQALSWRMANVRVCPSWHGNKKVPTDQWYIRGIVWGNPQYMWGNIIYIYIYGEVHGEISCISMGYKGFWTVLRFLWSDASNIWWIATAQELNRKDLGSNQSFCFNMGLSQNIANHNPKVHQLIITYLWTCKKKGFTAYWDTLKSAYLFVVPQPKSSSKAPYRSQPVCDVRLSRKRPIQLICKDVTMGTVPFYGNSSEIGGNEHELSWTIMNFWFPIFYIWFSTKNHQWHWSKSNFAASGWTKLFEQVSKACWYNKIHLEPDSTMAPRMVHLCSSAIKSSSQ